MTHIQNDGELSVLPETELRKASAFEDVCCFGMVRCMIAAVFISLAGRLRYPARILFRPFFLPIEAELPLFFQYDALL